MVQFPEESLDLRRDVTATWVVGVVRGIDPASRDKSMEAVGAKFGNIGIIPIFIVKT